MLGVPLLSPAQEGGSPSYFTGAEDAQPLRQSSANSSSLPRADVLRFKAPRPIVNPYVDRQVVKASITLDAPARSESEPAAAPRATADAVRSAPGAAWNRSRISGHQGPARSVRLAAHDPFSDPFGDRLAQNEAPSLQAPMNDAAQPPAAQAAPETDNLPPPMPQMPAAGDGRSYDPEQCRKWEAACEELKSKLRNDRITSITLNIAPPYSPSTLEGESPDEYRKRDLGAIPPREWRSRSGEVLATGRLGNVEYGRVSIVDDAGQEIASPSIKELGTDEICFITHHWQVPYHCYANPELEPRNWVPSTFTYQASALCHKPLYFEEVQLERYGHTAGPIKQPILSGAHFFANIAVLPYKMGINPPLECQYPLGYYRPGSCAPWHIPPIPLSVRGALAEAGVWIGGIYILP